MISYGDMIDRTQTGRSIKKEDWDFNHVLLPARELVEKYSLEWDAWQVVPDNLDLADRAFQAAMELAEGSGIYCISTGRVVQFSRAELETSLHAMPQELVLGEGDDARLLFTRQIMDPRPPIIWGGNPGAPTPEEIFLPCVKSWMKEPLVDLVTCGSLTEVAGRRVTLGEPTEILATRRELQLMREALRQVDRPGMGMLAAQSSLTELGDLSVAHPDYLRPCDAHLIPVLNELIIDHSSIARVVNALEYGMHNASLACVMVGGLAGDAPGAAIVQAASFILANLVCKADYHLLHPIHIRHIATSTRSVMWVQSVVLQAFARNAPCIIVADIYPKSGAVTRELLYEVAANALALTASGGHLEGVGAADGALPNATGLEARWMGEVGHAAAKQQIDLEEANRLVLALLERYEHVFDLPGGNPGVSFEQAYELETLQPVDEWIRIYDQVKSELSELGLVGL